MKKVLMVLISLIIISTSVLATGRQETEETSTEPQATDKLVVYSPNSDGLINSTVPKFEEKYGVKVEVISAGTGELFKRLQGEKNNPYADVAFGGAFATYMINEDLFEPYLSKNNGNVIDLYQNTTGFITPYVLDGSIILVNKSLIGDKVIRGYKDLLDPDLKGKIVSANPTASSSAYAHLTNMLNAIGGGDYESTEAWAFVEKLFANTVVIGSSSSVWKGVRDGEYTIGLSYEDPSVTLVRDGADVEVVYMNEGVVYLPAGSGIVKGAENLVNAQLFIDFIISEEIQNIYGTSLTNRPVMADVATPAYMTNISEIKLLKEDMEYVYQHKEALQEHFKEIFVEVQ